MKELTNIVSGKKILFIGPVYFNYEVEIIEELQRAGATVTFIQENVDATTLKFLIINRMPSNIQSNARDKYFIKKIDELKSKDYDFVFCLRIDLFSDKVLTYLKEQIPQARYILHYWDSCKRMRGAHDRARYFDLVSTFDKADYEAYKSEGWRFRPLFYIPGYAGINKNPDKDVDIIYIATLSRERAVYYTRLKDYCEAHGISLYAKFYIRRFVWNLQKNYEEYKPLDESVLTFKSIPAHIIQEKMAHSKVMFDCSHSAQSGLTMRTIECIGACEKLATTNYDIADYDFYNEHNYLLIKDYNFEGLEEFVNRNYQDLPENVYNKYSLKCWLQEIFFEE